MIFSSKKNPDSTNAQILIFLVTKRSFLMKKLPTLIIHKNQIDIKYTIFDLFSYDFDYRRFSTQETFGQI